MDFDGPLPCEFDGICHQVVNHLLQSSFVKRQDWVMNENLFYIDVNGKFFPLNEHACNLQDLFECMMN